MIKEFSIYKIKGKNFDENKKEKLKFIEKKES